MARNADHRPGLSGSRAPLATVILKVVPRASRPGLTVDSSGALKVRLAAPPVDGAANIELIDHLSAALGIARRAITIAGGAHSRTKRVQIEGLTGDEAEARLRATARQE